MTRVSDVAGFAAAVAEGGALPFLALALMRARAGRRAACRDRPPGSAGKPWGVGILGFVPAELRARADSRSSGSTAPPFALIAGGRPDQARALEDGRHRRPICTCRRRAC